MARKYSRKNISRKSKRNNKNSIKKLNIIKRFRGGASNEDRFTTTIFGDNRKYFSEYDEQIKTFAYYWLNTEYNKGIKMREEMIEAGKPDINKTVWMSLHYINIFYLNKEYDQNTINRFENFYSQFNDIDVKVPTIEEYKPGEGERGVNNPIYYIFNKKNSKRLTEYSDKLIQNIEYMITKCEQIPFFVNNNILQFKKTPRSIDTDIKNLKGLKYNTELLVDYFKRWKIAAEKLAETGGIPEIYFKIKTGKLPHENINLIVNSDSTYDENSTHESLEIIKIYRKEYLKEKYDSLTKSDFTFKIIDNKKVIRSKSGTPDDKITAIKKDNDEVFNDKEIEFINEIIPNIK
jgi:hypothetical protein